jgi:hypothetical protein
MEKLAPHLASSTRPRPAVSSARPPRIAYVPAHPATAGQRHGPGDVEFEIRRLADGEAALPAFSSVAKLVAALGHAQPWVALPLENIRALMGAVGVRRIVIDPEVDDRAWRWRADDLTDLRAMVDGVSGE